MREPTAMARQARLGALAAIVAGALLLPSAAAGAAAPGLIRVLGVTGRSGRTLVGIPHAGARGGRPSAVAAPSGIVLATVDAQPFTGYENAIYAADDNTVYVAYKRFTQDPTGLQYVPAELRVAKSVDGGRTWTVQVADPNAIEDASTIDGTVSIDGDHGAVIYVAYHTRASGLFADMKLKVAKSVDGGATWTLQTLSSSGEGDYNSTRVLNATTVAVSAHGAGSLEGAHVFLTTNGGASWSDTLVEGGIGNGYYTSMGGTSVRTLFTSYYDSLYPDETDLHAARRAGGAWHAMVVDGTPGDQDLTGLGSSIWVSEGPTVWIAYEADTVQGSFVRVAKASASNPSWTIVPVLQQPGIGVNTAIHSVGTTDVYVSYWASTSNGQAMFAVSSDGGGTWTNFAVPEQQDVQPYMDSAAPSTAVQFVSYQARNAQTGQTVLRLARIT